MHDVIHQICSKIYHSCFGDSRRVKLKHLSFVRNLVFNWCDGSYLWLSSKQLRIKLLLFSRNIVSILTCCTHFNGSVRHILICFSQAQVTNLVFCIFNHLTQGANLVGELSIVRIGSHLYSTSLWIDPSIRIRNHHAFGSSYLCLLSNQIIKLLRLSF